MTGHRLRAPRENHAILAEPPLADVGTILAENRRLFQQQLQFFDVSWADLRQQARASALTAARNYLCAAGEPLPDIKGQGLLLAGHQPELFHPGVWIKNFALVGLARKHNAIPLNLVVDSDTAKSTQLHLPAGDHQERVPFDHMQGEVPFEERRVLDEQLFATLPERVEPLTKSWPFTPMLRDFWQDVKRQAQRTPLLGERLVAARRAWERRWGCHGFEVPLSELCRTEPFAWFACHLLSQLPRFHTIYNDAVHSFRRAHDIRSTSHPVPDLARDGDWFETPFWIWGTGQARRHRLFARLTDRSLDLRSGNDVAMSLAHPHADPEHTTADWLSLERQGIKIRTRALTTTILARMLLGDTFLHGIGGGKYDELTDVLIQRFYGVWPPRYLVLSATLLLPLPAFPATLDGVRRLAWERRDLWWNPDRHLPVDEASTLRKREWIERPCATPTERRTRFLQLREITAQMRSLAQEPYELLGRSLTEARQELSENQILQRRDYAFCLYPEAELREFLSGIVPEAR